MRVTILQLDIAWGKPSENQKHAEALINKSEMSDLYVLPEMWSTGFNISTQQFAEDENESHAHGSVAWMKEMAIKHNAAMCGSLAIRCKDGECRNRLYFVYPDGKLAHYDKSHLFSPGGEDKCFAKGNERVIVSYKEWRFMLLICYDLRFPVWSRCDDDYDAIIYVANWPSNRHDVWTTLLKARAMENQCYVIGANRTGNDVCCKYDGESLIINPYGKVLSTCGNDVCCATSELDLEALRRFRDKFAAQKDRDHFIMREVTETKTTK